MPRYKTRLTYCARAGVWAKLRHIPSIHMHAYLYMQRSLEGIATCVLSCFYICPTKLSFICMYYMNVYTGKNVIKVINMVVMQITEKMFVVCFVVVVIASQCV